VREAAQMGFTRCVVPAANVIPATRGRPTAARLVGVHRGEALDEIGWD
jgi:hypothetical protein